MLLAYNATSATIAANLGKWRPNAANPTGLYVPKLSDQFFRAWTSGAGREAGSYQGDAIRDITGQAPLSRMGSLRVGDYPASGALALRVDPLLGLLGTNGDTSFNMYGELSISAARVVPTADENRPANVALPVALYLGLPA